MTGLRRLDELLRAKDGDAGCTAGEEILDAYVELELAAEDPARVYPGRAIHLQSCPGCRVDHDGLLEVARRFADIKPQSGSAPLTSCPPQDLMSTINSPPTNHPGSAPGRAPGPIPTSIAVASYCRVTFDRPPINTITATTVAELIGLVEQDPALQVVVLDSANPAFYLADYDVDNDPGRTAALGLSPTPTISMNRAQS